MPPKKNQPSSSMANDDKADWSISNEAAFIGIVHGHVKHGELQCSTFKGKTWSIIDEEMFAKTRKRFGVDKLKSKFNRLRKRHREFSDLIACFGFGWDPVTNTVTTADEVWEDYIKTHPTSKSYRKKGLEHYDILGEIFNTTTATGQLRYSSNQIPLDSEEDRAVEEEFLNAGVHVEIPDENEDAQYGDSIPSELRSRSRRSPGASSSRGPKTVENYDSFMKDASELIKSRKARRTKKGGDEDTYAIEECVKFLRSFDIPAHKFVKLMNKEHLLNSDFKKLVMCLQADEVKALFDSL